MGCATAVINLYYLALGNKNDQSVIAGYGLASLLMDVIFASFGIGLNGALETFVSQASGQKNYKLCSVYLHRSRIMVTLTFIVSYSILLRSESILLFLGQNPRACAVAQEFIYYNAFSVYLIVLNDGMRRYLNSLNMSYIAF